MDMPHRVPNDIENSLDIEHFGERIGSNNNGQAPTQPALRLFICVAY
jgi:hypothetical protein